jgi:hypothetical protein
MENQPRSFFVSSFTADRPFASAQTGRLLSYLADVVTMGPISSAKHKNCRMDSRTNDHVKSACSVNKLRVNRVILNEVKKTDVVSSAAKTSCFQLVAL